MSTLPALAERAHYYSTACIHLKHDKCTGECGYCSRPCTCSCHTKPATAGQSTEEAMPTPTPMHDPNKDPNRPSRTEAENDERDDETDDSTADAEVNPGTEPGAPGDRY